MELTGIAKEKEGKWGKCGGDELFSYMKLTEMTKKEVWEMEGVGVGFE